MSWKLWLDPHMDDLLGQRFELYVSLSLSFFFLSGAF